MFSGHLKQSIDAGLATSCGALKREGALQSLIMLKTAGSLAIQTIERIRIYIYIHMICININIYVYIYIHIHIIYIIYMILESSDFF